MDSINETLPIQAFAEVASAAMKSHDKKILTIMMEYDYGEKARGFSGERTWFYENLKTLARDVEPFWYDDYLADPLTLRKKAIAAADAAKPDLIFLIPYTDQFDGSAIEELSRIAPTVAWFGDDHWRFDSFSSKLAPHFSHVVTTDPWSLKSYKNLGIDAILSEWAAQSSRAFPDPAVPIDYKWDVTFVGGANDVRTWFVRELKKRNVHVECFGAGWPNGRIDEEKMNEIFLRSRINLNLSNSVPQDISFVLGTPRQFARWIVSKKTSEQVKARNFEIPVAGGFQLSKYALGIERYLEIGKEIAVFNTVDECAKQIGYYLFKESERQKLTIAGAKRARAEHTYINRLQDILAEVWK